MTRPKMSPQHPSRETIALTYRWLAHAPHGVTEVRAISRTRPPLIGYFDNENAFVDACVDMNDDANVYAGIQPRPRSLMAHEPNTMCARPVATKAHEITTLIGTVIDIDPVRPTGTASTEAELAATMEVAQQALPWCRSMGFRPPRRMMSGNGVQLWFALPPIPVTDENRARLQAALRWLEAEIRKLANAQVKVDSIHDFPRIIKVIGTWSRKGVSLLDRPHRRSYAIDPLDRVEDHILLQHLLSLPHESRALPLLRQVTSTHQSERDADEKSPVEPQTPQGLLRLLDNDQTKQPQLPATVTTEHSPSSANDEKPSSTQAAAPERVSRREEKAFRFVRDPERLARFEPPVPMCGPFLRLWEMGCADRSLALFNMVLYFMHHGLTLPDILPWMVQYDRRVLGKLEGRDAEAEIRRCYDKIRANRDRNAHIAPPCHSLQQLAYCSVNSDPTVRCDLEDNFSNVDIAVARIPRTLTQPQLRYRLLPIFRAIDKRADRTSGEQVQRIAERHALSTKETDNLLAIAKSLNSVVPIGDPTARFLGKIYAQENYYFVEEKNFSGVISSFTLNPTLLVETDEGDVFIADATTTYDKVIPGLKLPMEAFRSRRDFQACLKHAQLAWTGKDVHTQGLLNELASVEIPSRRGVSMIGRHEYENRSYWVHSEGTLDRNGVVPESPIMHFRLSTTPIATRFRLPHVSEQDLLGCAQTFFRHIQSINAPGVVLPVLGWFFAAPLKPVLMRILHAFPLLFVWGTAGSGKSSMLTDIFWPLAGIQPDGSNDKAFSCVDTEFAMIQLFSSTNAVPIVLDEYKPDEFASAKVSQLHKLLRSLYRGEIASRGNRNMSVLSYYLTAPVVLAGETRPRDQALVERAIIVNPDKAALERNYGYRSAFQILQEANLHRLAARYIQFTLGRDVRADLELATRLLAAALERLPNVPIPERVRVNLRVMVLGLYLFEQFASSLGCQLPHEIDVVGAVQGVLGEILECDEGRVEDALDRFVRTLAVMAVQGQLEPRTHYLVKDELLYLHLESCHDAWLKHLREINHKGDAPDLRAMRKLAQEHVTRKSYVTSVGDLIYFRPGSDRRRALTLDLSRTSVVTIEEFPMIRIE